jgi:hypothetical protein
MDRPSENTSRALLWFTVSHVVSQTLLQTLIILLMNSSIHACLRRSLSKMITFLSHYS